MTPTSKGGDDLYVVDRCLTFGRDGPCYCSALLRGKHSGQNRIPGLASATCAPVEPPPGARFLCRPCRVPVKPMCSSRVSANLPPATLPKTIDESRRARRSRLC